MVITERPQWHIPESSYGYIGKFLMLSGTCFKDIGIFFQMHQKIHSKELQEDVKKAFAFSLV